MKPVSKRIREAFQDELVEGTVYRIDLDRVDVIPHGSTGILRSLPLTGDRDKVQIGDAVRIMRVGEERVAMVGDVALGFDIEEEVTEAVGGVTTNELEETLTNRPLADPNAVIHDGEGRVGINCAPDPQFDLDVAGSIRTGGYFVGRHALQVTGALMICHFDGPYPAETDTKGELNGHMGQIGTITGTYDFRPGKFNKALCMSEGIGAILTYPAAGAIDVSKPGTISFWRRLEPGHILMGEAVWLEVAALDDALFSLGNSTDSLDLELTITTAIGETTTYSRELPIDNEFHHYTITWDGTTAKIYIDGLALGEETPTVYTPILTPMHELMLFVEINTIDDLVILDHCIDASEVRAIYESNAPVFAETSTWGFRTASSLAYADSDGLWAVSSAGNPAFGVSGVDGKYWGEHYLDSGDLLIGKGESYVKWDESTATLIISGDGAGLTAINGSNITTGTISASRIDVASITISNANIADGTIAGAKITNLDASKITTGLLSASRIDVDGITITDANIVNGTISGAKIASLDAAKITTGYINAARINAGTITAGMLATTALDAKTITGSTIRTSAANPRVEMTTTGLRGYDSTGVVQANFSSDGKFYAGASAVRLDANGLALVTGAGTKNTIRWMDATFTDESVKLLNGIDTAAVGYLDIFADGVKQLRVGGNIGGIRARGIVSGVNSTNGIADGDIGYVGDLVRRDATGGETVGYIYVPLQAPITIAGWTNITKSTTAKTSYNMISGFGLPTGVKAVKIRAWINDSGSAASTNCWFLISPNNTANVGDFAIFASGLPNDRVTGQSGIINLTASGVFYYQVAASGTGTMNITLEVWGYFI